MKNRFLLIAFIGILTLNSCKKDTDSTPDPPPTQDDIVAIDNAVQTFLTTYNVPGASLAVSKNGMLVYRKGYGVADQAANTPVTINHRFRLASVSKTFTGAAIMKLVQAGSLSLSDKVFGATGILGTTYGTPPYNANVSNITVGQLLTNTSGSWGAATGGDVIDQNPTYTNVQMLNWVLNTRPNPKAPGTFYDYSNVGFWLAGRVIEKVSGKTYLNYITQDLLASTGATNVDMAGKTEAETKTNEVKYYGQGNDAIYTYNIAFPRRDADGGLIATASDLLRLVTAIDGFNTRPDILNSSSITAFTTVPTGLTNSSTYANGIAIWSAENLWYNYGSLPGTRTGFMRHNNGMSVVLLLNSRADPAGNESPFIFGMQNLMLNMVKGAYPWQNTDQF
jgi:CubicO group peptidase (beta-lactamase class C family)